MPALFTRTSGGPSAASRCATARCTSTHEPTSAATDAPRPPSSSSTAARSPPLRATRPTDAPRAPAARATARPIPRDAPVTMATAPDQRPASGDPVMPARYAPAARVVTLRTPDPPLRGVAVASGVHRRGVPVSDHSAPGAGGTPTAPESQAGPGTESRLRRWLRAPRTHWVLSLGVVLVAVVGGGGLFVWSKVQPLLSARYEDVAYTVPNAPRLTALPGETVFGIDPTQSSVSYGVDEKIVGQSASHTTGSTNGIAGDLAINTADPSQSRIGTIVVNVEELHSNNRLRDARIREDFLQSHANPLAQLTTTSVQGLPPSISEGTTYPFTLAGTLTAHGRTTPITWTGTAQLAGGKLTADATTHVKMSSLGVGPISLAGLVTTSDDVTLTLKVTALDRAKFDVPTSILAPGVQQASGRSPSFSKDIEPILEAHCASCHEPGQVGAAHWVLDNAGDAAKVADGLGTVVQARYMPPWPASSVGVPLKWSKALDQQTIDTVVRWADAGGKLDVPASTKIRPSKSAPGVLPRHDVVMKMPQAYAGSLSNPNDYRCFVLDPHLTKPMYMTGYEVIPGHLEEIHHAQIFHIDATQAAEGQALSGKDGKAGWQCYAGPNLPDRSGHATSITPTGTDGRTAAGDPGTTSTTAPRKRHGFSFTGQPGLVAGWVPGQDPVVYPEHSGVLMQPGDALVLQIHYHYELPPVPDRSTVALQLDPVSNDIKPLEIVNPLGPVEIPCMPGDTAPLCDRSASIANDVKLYGPMGAFVEQGLLALCGKTPQQLTAGFDGVAHSSCDSRVPESGLIVGAMGHMHTLGQSFRLTLDPGTPQQQVLLDIPTWNFDWQMNYELATPIHVNAGDVIRMECSWNRAIDPTRPQKYIVFAEGTEDEMCFSTYALVPDQASGPTYSG